MSKLNNLKIAIFIDRDVTIRHFLDSGVFDDLKNNHKVKLIFPPIGDKRLNNHCQPERFGFDYSFIKIPEKRIQLWKWIFYINTLTYKKGDDWKVIRRVFSVAVGQKMSNFFKISSLPLIKQIIVTLIKIKIYSYKINQLEKFIDSFKPDLIIHPSTFQGVYVNELALISKKNKIPYILLMNSWDNPCLKNTSIYKPSIVGVWGEQTKYHAIKYMDMPEKKIKILGAAQFQCFNKNSNKTKDEILSEYKFSKSTLLILYAGSSQGNDEYRHLKYLEKLCLNLDKKIRIIYRPHPYLSDINTAKKILKIKSKIIKIDNLMITFMRKLIRKEIKSFFSTDYSYTHDLLSAADIVISPLSTILIESLCHGKESICLIPEDEDSSTLFKDKKRLPCFKDVIECNAIQTLENIKDLEVALTKSYEKCKSSKNRLINKKYSDFFVDMKKPYYKERLNKCIEDLVQKQN